MSNRLRQLAIEAFKARAEVAWQSGSYLRDRVMVISGVEAEIQHFPVVGRVTAKRRASQADVVPSNIANKRPSCALSPREAFEYLDKQDTALTNVDAMRAYGETLGSAVAREFDEDIVESLKQHAATDAQWMGAYSPTDSNPAATFTPATMTVQRSVASSAGTANRLDANTLAAARTALVDQDFKVNEHDCTLVLPAHQLQYLLTDEHFASFDYLQQGSGRDNVTATSRFGMIYGCKPIVIGQAGRIDGVGTLDDNNTAYMFIRNAIGLAIGTTENMGVYEWVPQKRSYMVGAECNAGACRIQNAGIVKIEIN